MAESCSSIVLSLETQDWDEPDSFLRNRICVCDNEEERERNGIWRLGRVGGSMVGGEKMVLRGSDTNNCVGREKDGIGIVWIE